MDQFRGYTVVCMILVNLVSRFHWVPPVFKHHDNYLSYADTIMPNFLFAVGFSFRLTMLRRLQRVSLSRTYWTYIRRSLLLIFVSTLGVALVVTFESPRLFENFSQQDWQVSIAIFLKSYLWQTLSIIGVTQLVILPLVPFGSRVRWGALFAFAIGHAALCYWFNWGFVLGQPDNWMVQLWNTGADRSWDGGFFGPLCWTVPMLGGTLAFDVIAGCETRQFAISRLMKYGVAFTVLGYIISCGTRLYDIVDGSEAAPQRNPSDWKRAESPFVSSPTNVDLRHPLSLLAEPPFVAPPSFPKRLDNYWMMSKRIPTLSFILCATGLGFVTYAGFVWLNDVRGFQLGVFRTFGTNPLLSYFLSEILNPFVHIFVPYHSSVWYSVVGFMAYLGVNYACIRFCERNKLFLRL